MYGRIAAVIAIGALALSFGSATADRRLASTAEKTKFRAAHRTGTVSDTLTVMTLNTAHGRGTGIHQALQSTRKQIRNLDRIGRLLQRERPDVVALQEVDGQCIWSGNFSHVQYLAESGHYSDFVRGELVDRPGLSHGLALLSKLSLDDPLAIRFRPTPAGTAKGFVISTIEWPGRPDLLVDVLSVHLEAFRPALRERQVDELIESLAGRERPMIVMGDFNTDWNGRGDSLKKLADALALQAHEPQSPEHVSLPVFRRRLDWILISEDFEFRSYQTLDDSVSDHRAVVADIGLRLSGTTRH